MLYKYPQREYPYAGLLDESRRRGRNEPEYELLDTGVFAENRYFDVFVEYAQAEVDDVLMRVTVHNRGPEAATLHVLPQLGHSQYLGVAPRRGKAGDWRCKDGHVEVQHDRSGRVSLVRRYRTLRCSSPTTKPTRAALRSCPTPAS